MRLALQLLLSSVGTAALTGCSPQYNIDGNSTIAGLDGQKLYLRATSPGGEQHVVNLDSCEIVHGCFQFGGAMDSVQMADLYMGDQPMMPVVIENGSVFVQMDNIMQSISGGPLNDRLNDFLTKRTRYEFDLFDLNRRAQYMVYEGKTLEQIVASIDPIKNSLLRNIKALEVQFIKDNYNNVLGPGYFMRMCNNLGMPTPDADIYDILVDAPDAFLHSPYVEYYIVAAGITPDDLQAERAKRGPVKQKKSRKK